MAARGGLDPALATQWGALHVPGKGASKCEGPEAGFPGTCEVRVESWCGGSRGRGVGGAGHGAGGAKSGRTLYATAC